LLKICENRKYIIQKPNYSTLEHVLKKLNKTKNSMKNLILVFMLFATAATQATAQNQYTDAIKESLHNYQQALLVKDYKTAASLMHPGVVEKGGGISLYADILEVEAKSLTSGGIKVMDFKTLDPQEIFPAGEEMHCIVPHELTVQLGDKYYTGVEHMLAASMDKGDTWFFVDLKAFDVTSIQEFIPNYNASLAIPKTEQMQPIN
jgi:hypothetical protein